MCQKSHKVETKHLYYAGNLNNTGTEKTIINPAYYYFRRVQWVRCPCVFRFCFLCGLYVGVITVLVTGFLCNEHSSKIF